MLPIHRAQLDEISLPIASYYRMTIAELRCKRRFSDWVYVRGVLTYIARRLTGLSHDRIGEYLDRDHSTIISAEKRVMRMLASDKRVQAEVDHLMQKLGDKK